MTLPDQSALVREADNLRFQLGYLIRDAKVLGDSMDAHVRFREDIEAVHLGSLRRYLERYDRIRSALDQEGT